MSREVCWTNWALMGSWIYRIMPHIPLSTLPFFTYTQTRSQSQLLTLPPSLVILCKNKRSFGNSSCSLLSSFTCWHWSYTVCFPLSKVVSFGAPPARFTRTTETCIRWRSKVNLLIRRVSAQFWNQILHLSAKTTNFRAIVYSFACIHHISELSYIIHLELPLPNLRTHHRRPYLMFCNSYTMIIVTSLIPSYSMFSWLPKILEFQHFLTSARRKYL